MKRDPKPWKEMTSKERAAHVRMLREEAKTLPYDPNDDSLEILQTALTPTTERPH
jgi:hypothetical protein